MKVSDSSLLRRDQDLVWHPYTQHKTAADMLPIKRASGVYLYDESGRSYIDAISSWWTNIHGHSHPYIAEKIHAQALQLEHVIFAGCTHEPAVTLAERLLELLPAGFSKIFYSDNGSTAVEVALKMAIQFRANTNREYRKKILAFNHAYHGDSFGAMSVSGRSVFTRAFSDYLFEVVFIDTPTDENIESIKSRLRDQAGEIACFIYEPLVQGAGGMRMYEEHLLDELIGLAKQMGILCIADEVMTGFGRTGNLFASSGLKNIPDILCLSKALTGGTMPLAATVCTDEIFSGFLHDDLYKTFFHGHSYTANPIACAAALASLDLLSEKSCTEQLHHITKQNEFFVRKQAGNKKIMNPRCLGTILAFEFHSAKHEYLNKVKEETMKAGLDRGVLIRPLGNTVYIMPPYCISEDELSTVHACLEDVLPDN